MRFESIDNALAFTEECRDSQGNPKKPGDTWYEQDCKVLTCGLSPSGEIYVESTG